MSCRAAPLRVPLVYPTLQENERIAAPGVSQIRFQLFLSRAHPRCVMLLCDSHALVNDRVICVFHAPDTLPRWRKQLKLSEIVEPSTIKEASKTEKLRRKFWP